MTSLKAVGEGERGPEGMLVPIDAIEAIRDAADRYLGERPDDYKAKYEECRDALYVERRRVDELLSLMHTRTEENASQRNRPR